MQMNAVSGTYCFYKFTSSWCPFFPYILKIINGKSCYVPPPFNFHIYFGELGPCHCGAHMEPFASKNLNGAYNIHLDINANNVCANTKSVSALSIAASANIPNISTNNYNIGAYNGNASACNGNVTAKNNNISASNSTVGAYSGDVRGCNRNASACNGNVIANNYYVSACNSNASATIYIVSIYKYTTTANNRYVDNNDRLVCSSRQKITNAIQFSNAWFCTYHSNAPPTAHGLIHKTKQFYFFIKSPQFINNGSKLIYIKKRRRTYRLDRKFRKQGTQLSG